MDPLLNRISAKLQATDAQLSDLYMCGFRIPEVDKILLCVMPEASYEEKFPFFALFRFLNVIQCEMFCRSLVIALFKFEKKIVHYTQPFVDKQQFFKTLATISDDNDAFPTIFVKVVSDFL